LVFKICYIEGHSEHIRLIGEKDSMFRLTDGSRRSKRQLTRWGDEICGNMTDELACHLNCHTKQNAREGPDLHGRGKPEMRGAADK